MEPVKNELKVAVLQGPVRSSLDEKDIDMMTRNEVRTKVRYPVTDVTRVGHAAWRKVFYKV